MRAQILTACSALAGFGLLVSATEAQAQCHSACPPPPPCCAPPAPPTPPTHPGKPGGGYGGNVNVNVNVNASASATINASGNASATVGSFNRSGAGGIVYASGGYGNWSQGPGNVAVVPNFMVHGAAEATREAYSASRKVTKRVVLQAVCIDDKRVPHPASQVRPDREISEAYDGELYRCMAGTTLQVTYADYDGKISVDGGKTLTCGRGEALYHSRGGNVSCKTQIAQRACNERSLLRRFGTGVKILTMTREETYTAYKESSAQSSHSAGGTLVLDGGVGGIVH